MEGSEPTTTGGEDVDAAAGQGTSTASRPGSATPGGAGWAGELSERVIDTVARVRSRTTVKVVTGLRLLVYGFAVIVSLVTAAVLATLGVVRIWDAYVPVHPLGRRVWLGYVVIGGALFLVGALVMSRRRASRQS